MTLRIATLILLAMQPLFADEAERNSHQLRVLSYNIHHGEGVDRDLNLERIAGVIRSVEPDIVALQEVDQNAARTGHIDQPAELARLTEMQVVFGGNISLQGGEYGNAVLSRLKITQSDNHHLPVVDNGEQRGILKVKATWPSATESLMVLATHFDHRRDDQERIASAKAVNQLVSADLTQPALLIGDLNDVATSDTLRTLGALWKVSNDKPLPTIPVASPQRQIDFILVRPVERWRVIETRVLEEAVASDHRPIFSVLELLPPASR